MQETKKDDKQPYQHYQTDHYPNSCGEMDRALKAFKKVEKK